MSGHASIERLSLYVDAALAPAERRRVESHLEGCADCRHRLDGLRRVVARLEELPAATPPADMAVRIRRSAGVLGERREWHQPAGLPWRGLLAGPPLVHVFAVVLALGAIVYLFAFGVSGQRQGSTRIVLPAAAPAEAPARRIAEAPPPAAAEPLTAERATLASAAKDAGSQSRRLLGGVFYRQDGVWVEQGLTARLPDERLELSRTGAGELGDGELAELAGLDAPLRLRVGDRVVEIAFVPPAD